MSERIEKLLNAVQVMHHCTAAHVQSVPVRETFQGQTVWEGVVEVFDLSGHAKAQRCYAWMLPGGKEPQFVTVLGLPPVDSPLNAVRASILAAKRT